MKTQLKVSQLLALLVWQPHAGDRQGLQEDWEDEQGQWQGPLGYQDPQWQVLDERSGQDDEQTDESYDSAVARCARRVVAVR